MTLKRSSMVKKVGNIYSSLLLPIFEVYPDFSAVFFFNRVFKTDSLHRERT